MLSMVDEYQGALFDSDEEAKDKYRNKQAELEHGRALAVARTTAWNEGRPFPEDGAKYYQATQSVRPTPMLPLSELQQFGDHWSWAWDWAHPKQYEIRFAAWQRSRENYASGRPYVLAYVAKSRALALGCRIGRKRRILRIYKRADSSEPILCYWCLWPTERSDRHVDHVIPLVRGGAHAAENLRISCRHCNVSKGDEEPDLFAARVRERRLASIGLLRRIGGIKEKPEGFWDDFFGR